MTDLPSFTFVWSGTQPALGFVGATVMERK